MTILLTFKLGCVNFNLRLFGGVGGYYYVTRPDMTWYTLDTLSVGYGIYGALVVGGGVMVISATNAVHGVLWLVATFLCGVALFVSQGVDYIAFIFLIIYVGAIAILFLFVTMMLNLVVRTTFDMSNGLFAGFVIGGVLYGTLLYLSSANVVYSGA